MYPDLFKEQHGHQQQVEKKILLNITIIERTLEFEPLLGV